ncbi:MAG TPA: GNAT family N-acetyltransferase [Gemmatimonadaceae bacterium]|nr:GNAT family N-acetyltransferase [Gemmatimonadaceae bacterium]
MDLVWPAEEHLASYVDALTRGWSADTQRAADGLEELARIEADPVLFIAQQVDREGRGPPVVLPDGSIAVRIPGYRLWMWDGVFCGSISFRWQPGTTELPPHCLGHIGYSVVPWKRRLGYATRALALVLPLARREGLPFVELTTNLDNVASQRVILRNGGELVERFRKPVASGGTEALRYRILLGEPRPSDER